MAEAATRLPIKGEKKETGAVATRPFDNLRQEMDRRQKARH